MLLIREAKIIPVPIAHPKIGNITTLNPKILNDLINNIIIVYLINKLYINIITFFKGLYI